MPTRIPLNNRAPRSRIVDTIPTALGTFAAPQPDGFFTIRKSLDKQGARQVLQNLQTQLRNDRGGIKSGYLKIVNTTLAGEQMQIVRKSRLHALLNSGRMRQTNEALLTILERSELAPPEQVRHLRAYLQANGKAGTRTIARLLEQLPSVAEGGPIGQFARGSTLETRLGQIDAAFDAAGLSLAPEARLRLGDACRSLSMRKTFNRCLSALEREHPNATPGQMGRFVRAWVTVSESAKPPDRIPFLAIPARPWTSPRVCSAEQQAEYLIEAFKDSENRLLPFLDSTLAYSGQSIAQSGELVAQLVARLRAPEGSIEARALREFAAKSLEECPVLALDMNDVEAGDPPRLKQAFIERAEAFRTQHGYLRMQFHQPPVQEGAADQALSDAQREAIAGRAEAALTIAAVEKGWPVEGASMTLRIGAPPLGGRVDRLTASSSNIHVRPPQDSGPVSLTQSKLSHSFVALYDRADLHLSNVDFEGAFLYIRPTGARAWSLSGLETCSLESTTIGIDYGGIEQALRRTPRDQRNDDLMDLYLGKVGPDGKRAAPSQPILKLINSVPEHCAALKVSLVRDFIAHLSEVRASATTRLNLLMPLLRATPDLLRVEAIRHEVGQSVQDFVNTAWQSGGLEDFASVVRTLTGGSAPAAMIELVHANPTFRQMRALVAASRSTRDGSAEEARVFAEAFLAADARVRNELSDRIEAPGIQAALSEAIERAVATAWGSGDLAEFDALVGRLDQAPQSQSLRALLEAHPRLQPMRALLAASQSPRDLTVEQRAALAEALVMLDAGARERFFRQHLAKMAALLQPSGPGQAAAADSQRLLSACLGLMQAGADQSPEQSQQSLRANISVVSLILHAIESDPLKYPLADQQAALALRARVMELPELKPIGVALDDLYLEYARRDGTVVPMPYYFELDETGAIAAMDADQFGQVATGDPATQLVTNTSFFLPSGQPDVAELGHVAIQESGHVWLAAESIGERGPSLLQRFGLLGEAYRSRSQSPTGRLIQTLFAGNATTSDWFGDALKGVKLRLKVPQIIDLETQFSKRAPNLFDDLGHAERPADWPQLQLSESFARTLREQAGLAGVDPNTPRSMAHFLFAQSAALTRLSSEKVFGDGDNSIPSLRLIGYALFAEARKVHGALFPPQIWNGLEDRFLHRNNAFDCAEILSRMQLQLSRRIDEAEFERFTPGVFRSAAGSR